MRQKTKGATGFKQRGKVLLLSCLMGGLLCSLPSCAWWRAQSQNAEAQTQEAHSLKALLTEIRDLVAAQDYAALQSYFYPYQVLGVDVPKALTYGIQQQVKSDDFAYSEPALQRLLNGHLQDFRVVQGREREQILAEFFRGEQYEAWKHQAEPHFWLFTYDPPQAPEGYYQVTVLVVEEQGVYRLAFWENLDCLIRCERPRS